MFRSHWVSYATYFDLDSAFVNLSYYRYMLFFARVNSVSYKFFHLFATAHNRYSRINSFYYYITTMFAFEKISCHSQVVFNCSYLIFINVLVL